MARACVLLAEGFEEIEAIAILDVLRRAEVAAEAVALGDRRVTGSHGIPLLADRVLDEVAAERWDAVILPGGLPGSHNLRDDPRVRELLQAQRASGRIVAAICAAPIALGAAGVLEGVRATCYPGFEAELKGATCSEDRVVSDGNVITSRGPGTALEFSLVLVERLAGGETAGSLRAAMLVAT